MPQPPRFGFLAHRTPHLIELGGQPAALIQLLSATDLHLHVLGVQALQNGLIHRPEVRRLFLSSFKTVVGLTCSTRAVSRMPLAFIAISMICSLTSGDCPA